MNKGTLRTGAYMGQHWHKEKQLTFLRKSNSGSTNDEANWSQFLVL